MSRHVWYAEAMDTDVVTKAFDRAMEPLATCLTPDVADRILALRPTPDLAARVEVLADTCRDGTLTDEERAEYEAYIQAFDILGILQVQARSVSGARGHL